MTAEKAQIKQKPMRRKGAKSIYRTIDLIRTIAEQDDDGIGLSELARKSDLPIPTAHRIVSVLVAEGLLAFDPLSRRYGLGFQLYTLGHKARKFAIREAYGKCIRDVAGITGETVYLVVQSGFDSLCIDLVEGEFPIRIMVYDVGDRRPLGIGAGGLTLLAFLPEAETESILAANRQRYLDHGGLDQDRIRHMVDTARLRGYVFNDGNYLPGVNAVGVPVRDAEGKVIAAVSVAGTSERMDTRRAEEIAKTVRSCIDATIVAGSESR